MNASYPYQNSAQRKIQGFTLIEVMIVVVILGILAAIASPIYADYVNRARRTAAQEQMLQIQQLMERYRSPRDTYVGADAAQGAFTLSGLNRFPTDMNQQVMYNFRVSPPVLTATAYTITATPVGIMANDACGTFILNSIGQRSLSGNANGKTLNACWSQ